MNDCNSDSKGIALSGNLREADLDSRKWSWKLKMVGSSFSLLTSVQVLELEGTCENLEEAIYASGQQLNSTWGPPSLRKCSNVITVPLLFWFVEKHFAQFVHEAFMSCSSWCDYGSIIWLNFLSCSWGGNQPFSVSDRTDNIQRKIKFTFLAYFLVVGGWERGKIVMYFSYLILLRLGNKALMQFLL